MPPLSWPAKRFAEAIHVEHLQIAMPALGDLLRRHAAQIADVADVFFHGEIGIEAERLRQVSGLRARLTRRLAEDLQLPGSGFHDARENLERGSLARAVRTDQTENLALSTSKLMPRTASTAP